MGTSNRRRHRVARFTGSAAILVGLALVVWGLVIWRAGDPVTGLYTRWQQRQLEQQLAVVERAFPPPEPAPRVGDKPTEAELARLRRRQATVLRNRSSTGDAIGRIRVGRLGLDMILVYGTDERSLRRGPGVDRRTRLPGEGKLVYIAGHRTTFGAPFARIDRMQPGDRVELDMPYGTFLYRVTSHVIVPADDLARLRSRGREEIALQACHPRFSAAERYIVYAVPLKAPGTRVPASRDSRAAP